MEAIKCAYCESIFTPITGNQRFCSESCQKHGAHAEKHGEYAPYERVVMPTLSEEEAVNRPDMLRVKIAKE